MTITKEEAEKRVAKGAAHLDRARPGWFQRIDVGTLTLWDGCGCIVGQLCGGDYFPSRLDIPHCVDYGFDFPGWETDECKRAGMSREEVYLPLQDAWIQEIARRLHPVEAAQAHEQAQTVDAVGQPLELAHLTTRA